MSNGDVAYEEGYTDSGIDVWGDYGSAVTDTGTADPQPPTSYEANYPESPPSADIYTQPPVSLSDAVRSAQSGVTYPGSSTPSQDTSGFAGLFKSVLGGVVTVTQAALQTVSRNTIARAIPGQPSSSATYGGARALPTRPFIFPSSLGGGQFGGGALSSLPIGWIVVGVLAVVVAFTLFRRS